MLEFTLKPGWGLGDFLSGPGLLFLEEVGEDTARLSFFRGELLVTA